MTCRAPPAPRRRDPEGRTGRRAPRGRAGAASPAGGRDAAGRDDAPCRAPAPHRDACASGRAAAHGAAGRRARRRSPQAAGRGGWRRRDRKATAAGRRMLSARTIRCAERFAPDRAAARSARQAAQRIEQRQRPERIARALRWRRRDVGEAEPVDRDAGRHEAGRGTAFRQDFRHGFFPARGRRRQDEPARGDHDQPPCGRLGWAHEAQHRAVETAGKRCGRGQFTFFRPRIVSKRRRVLPEKSKLSP